MNQGIIPGAIGLKDLNLQESVSFAGRHGFDTVMINIREVHEIVQQHGADYVVDLLAEYGVRPGAWSVPVRWRDDEHRNDDLASLPELMETAHAIGCPRATSGVQPGGDDISLDEQFTWMVDRLRPVAELLETGGIKVGLEFIGTPSYRKERWKNPEFIHDLAGIRALIDNVGRSSLGILFDVWHHWVSGGTPEQIDDLSADEVVLVHVNDAPEGRSLDEQIDNQRTLPMETGVIPVPEMLRRLQAIGFDGPVMPEPFSAGLEALAAENPDDAGTKVKESMDALWKAAGFAV
ncbi:MAG TPA: sugar phosphate isomerase/epimerase family protein [Thermomicrobiales bacterium]|nr:sugar phosphate isomerase/epimerase family protein [Thermomicrobiales bacterium]